jgi:uncharacterized membrane protein YdcZ (DUF606 family)
MAMFADVTIPLQSAANAQLNKGRGQVTLAALAIYVVALCGPFVCAPFFGVSLRGLGMRAAAIPRWAMSSLELSIPIRLGPYPHLCRRL